MSQSFAEELSGVQKSHNLAVSLERAFDYARNGGQPTVMLEHLLLALSEDSEAVEVLSACNVDLDRLRTDIAGHLGRLEARGHAGEPAADPVLVTILRHAAAAAQKSGRAQLNGAIVLAAIIGDGKSNAAQILEGQGLTFQGTLQALQTLGAQQSAKPQERAGPQETSRSQDNNIPPGTMPAPAAAPAATAAAASPSAASPPVGNAQSINSPTPNSAPNSTPAAGPAVAPIAAPVASAGPAPDEPPQTAGAPGPAPTPAPRNDQPLATPPAASAPVPASSAPPAQNGASQLQGAAAQRAPDGGGTPNTQSVDDILGSVRDRIKAKGVAATPASGAAAAGASQPSKPAPDIGEPEAFPRILQDRQAKSAAIGQQGSGKAVRGAIGEGMPKIVSERMKKKSDAASTSAVTSAAASGSEQGQAPSPAGPVLAQTSIRPQTSVQTNPQSAAQPVAKRQADSAPVPPPPAAPNPARPSSVSPSVARPAPASPSAPVPSAPVFTAAVSGPTPSQSQTSPAQRATFEQTAGTRRVSPPTSPPVQTDKWARAIDGKPAAPIAAPRQDPAPAPAPVQQAPVKPSAPASSQEFEKRVPQSAPSAEASSTRPPANIARQVQSEQAAPSDTGAKPSAPGYTGSYPEIARVNTPAPSPAAPPVVQGGTIDASAVATAAAASAAAAAVTAARTKPTTPGTEVAASTSARPSSQSPAQSQSQPQQPPQANDPAQRPAQRPAQPGANAAPQSAQSPQSPQSLQSAMPSQQGASPDAPSNAPSRIGAANATNNKPPAAAPAIEPWPEPRDPRLQPPPGAPAGAPPGYIGGMSAGSEAHNNPAGAPYPPADDLNAPRVGPARYSGQSQPQPQPQMRPAGGAPQGAAGAQPGAATMGGSKSGSKVTLGQLIENIPRIMRVAIPATVEVRIARDKVEALSEGMQGHAPVQRHDLFITKAMTVKLRAPDGGFWIETASPETQWIENTLGLLHDEFASWRWTVTPQTSGAKRLQLVVSARTVGTDGLAAETPLPEQVITVKVRINYKQVFKKFGGWVLAALVGGAISTVGGSLAGTGGLSKIMALIGL